jgi:hypothetical protein
MIITSTVSKHWLQNSSMPRYFLEVAYKGTRYSGFQIQQNAITVQSEVEQALATLHRTPVSLTGSSRTMPVCMLSRTIFTLMPEKCIRNRV